MLTGGSYLLAHGLTFKGTAPIRSAMSVAAISITTLLALKNLSVKERLRAMERERTNLARFFSQKLVGQLVQIDVPLSVTRNQPAAVLFVDVIDFTAYSSVTKLDEVIAMLRDLLAVLSDCVFSRNGMIDKFLGNGLMAVFGPPMPSPLDATNAVSCALAMLRSVDEWNRRCHRSGAAAIRIAIGIHSLWRCLLGGHRQRQETGANGTGRYS
jgi:adenylate cyclase